VFTRKSPFFRNGTRNSERNHSNVQLSCRIVKKGRKFPQKYKKQGLIDLGQVKLGIVEEKGEDLEASHPFRKCNLADFIDRKGYFNLVKFLDFNKQSFPYLHKLSCCLASLRTNEVGCERFFSIAGYVSNPRRTNLKVTHYESLAMLKRNLQQIYVDEEWVVKEYMSLEKNKRWADEDNKNDILVAELEEELYAEDMGVNAEQLGSDDEGGGKEVQQQAIEVEDSDDSEDDTETSGST
jgi:hAT family C-terminal dimerisation region